AQRLLRRKAHNGSGTNPVGVALFTKRKGEGSSGPHSVGGGVADQLVICQAWSDCDEDDLIDAITSAAGSSSPFSLEVPSLTVTRDGSVEVAIAGTWSFPVDTPPGYTSYAQHSF